MQNFHIENNGDMMNQVKQQDLFIEFMQSFDVYLKKAHVIAENNDDESILNVKSIGNNYLFYSLDSISQTRSLFYTYEVSFTPKTVDAIKFKKCEDGRFIIYLIEFKGDKIHKKTAKRDFFDYIKQLENERDHALNSIEREEKQDILNHIKPLYSKYSDSLLNDLALKPLECVTVALPLIYKDYLNKHEAKEIFDIVDFLRKSVINYYVVVIPEDDENTFRTRTNAKTLGSAVVDDIIEEDEITKDYESNLKAYYERYKQAGIINSYKFMDTSEFNNFVLTTFDN